MSLTLPPVDSWEVEEVKGPSYKVDSRCCNPACKRWADHAHHLFRRSKTGGPTNWIRIHDEVIGNLVPLCAPCHEDITGAVGGHKAAIRWHDHRFLWCKVITGIESGTVRYIEGPPLSWQPPMMSDTAVAIYDKEEPCPTCGHERAKKRPKREARKRKTWTVQVPDDEEDGAIVLDEYIDTFVPLLGLDPDGGAMTRYHTITRMFAFALVHAHLLPNGKEG